jgi:hypothetical protein
MPGLRSQVIELATGRYVGANDTHLTEMLAQRDGLVLSRASVQRILRAEHLERPVPASTIDDDILDVRVVMLEDGADRVLDELRLVQGGRDDRDERLLVWLGR